MALIKCAECKGVLSTRATICPHCGAPKRDASAPSPNSKNIANKILIGIFAALVALLFYANQMKPSAPPVVEAQPNPNSAPKVECAKDDLQCLGDKGVLTAGIFCAEPIEKLASHSVKWTDGWLEPKFSRFRWSDKDAGVITYIGDRAEFQNGFGAFTPVIYECDLASDGKTVLAVRANEGRLP